MTTTTTSAQVWAVAVDKYLGELRAPERERVLLVGDAENLVRHVSRLQEAYAARISAQWFDRLAPILDWVSKLAGFLDSTFHGVSHGSFAPLWGSLSYVLELASTHARGLEQLVEVLESVHRAFPRLKLYENLVDDVSDEFATALVGYYVELIGVCRDAIDFFNRRPIKNLLLPSFTSFKDKTSLRVARLRDLTCSLDWEANARTGLRHLRQQDEHHKQVFKLLSRVSSPLSAHYLGDRGISTMLFGKLPFQNLPSRKNSFFFGRKDELHRITTALRPAATPAENGKQLAVCLHGLAGAGKTQLALEFAYRHMESYDAVLWVSSETSVRLTESIGAIARGIGLADESMQHPDQLRGIVKRWLFTSSKRGASESSVSWLLIFDNVEDTSLIEPYWPQTSRGSIIVTCKSADLASRFASNRQLSIPVEPFTPTTGASFLLSLIYGGNDEISENERMLAGQVTASVGHHPLALDLIGHYVRRCGKTLASFLRDNPAFEKTFLFGTHLESWTENAYQHSIGHAWTMHLATPTPGPSGSNRSLDSSSRLLLYMLSLLDQDGVPLGLLRDNKREAALHLGPDRPEEMPNLDELVTSPFNDATILDHSVLSLLDFALVTVDNKVSSLKCHRLVRIAVSNAMTARERYLVFNRLAFFLNASFPTQSNGRHLHDQWETCETLATQAVALLETYSQHSEEVGCPIVLSRVAIRCSWYFLETGQYAIALKMVNQAISICETALDMGNHPGYSARIIRDLITRLLSIRAAVEREKPAADHGLAVAQDICSIREKNRRPDNPQDDYWFSIGRGNLAVSLMAVGRADEALPILSEMLASKDLKAMEDQYLCNMCLCRILLAELEDAVAYYAKAIEAVRRLRGENGVQMAVILFYAAKIAHKRGDLKSTYAALERCLQIRKASMPHHHATGFTLHQIGVIMDSEGNHEAAIPILSEALEILTGGECHPGAVCRTAFALSDACMRFGDPDASRRYREVAQTYRAKIGDDVPAGDANKYKLSETPAEYDVFVTVGLR